MHALTCTLLTDTPWLKGGAQACGMGEAHIEEHHIGVYTGYKSSPAMIIIMCPIVSIRGIQAYARLNVQCFSSVVFSIIISMIPAPSG